MAKSRFLTFFFDFFTQIELESAEKGRLGVSAEIHYQIFHILQKVTSRPQNAFLCKVRPREVL